MKIIACEIQLSTNFDSGDDVLQIDISQKRVVIEGIEAFFRNFLENQVRPELGIAYRVPVEIPISYGVVPGGNVAVMKLYLPEMNDSLRHKLTVMLAQDIRREFGEKAVHYSGLIDYQREAA